MARNSNSTRWGERGRECRFDASNLLFSRWGGRRAGGSETKTIKKRDGKENVRKIISNGFAEKMSKPTSRCRAALINTNKTRPVREREQIIEEEKK